MICLQRLHTLWGAQDCPAKGAVLHYEYDWNDTMAWQAVYNEQNNFVESVFSGELSDAEFEGGINECLRLSKVHNTVYFLTDCTNLIGGGGLTKILDVALQIASLDEFWKYREAIVAPTTPDALKAIKFYEVALNNRGFNVRVFADLESARLWLLNRKPSQ